MRLKAINRLAYDLTCEKFEGCWPTPPLCNPEHIFFLIHVQTWINHYWPCPVLTTEQKTHQIIFLTKIDFI